ncbi:3-oxoacyl-[acyl-carrier-protein] reductase FabG [Vanrija pseudolonga]|uniref:3-oxoacyl-[acyl-carrier-protein] reductase FabG n=1 Tax=Vanrija pseudolonga TaxID=143232 RepID=A0AAF0YB75_9TREE|nr:3-oxoacyl-[acyl-carrier-protein] reductase FabG [Vanrija pseudolonga]
MAAAGRLAGKIAVITGSSSGIGRATVDAFVKHGAKVVAVDVNLPTGPGAAPFPKHNVEFLRGSVTQDDIWRRAFSTAKANYGSSPNVLINAAGVLPTGSVLDLTDEDLDRVLAVNLKAPLHGMQKFIRALLDEKRTGAIVNVTSIAGERVFPHTPAYDVSKAALSHLTRATAAEVGDKGIRVNAVAPGVTRTGMTRDSLNAEALARLAPHTALGRVGEPEEIANAIVYLASDEASYVTGHVLVNDGGYIIQ